MPSNLPPWLLSILIQEIERFFTPELLKKLEAEAAQFVCCKLKAMADAMGVGPVKDGLEAALVVVAGTLGADLSKCPA